MAFFEARTKRSTTSGFLSISACEANSDRP